MATDPDCVFCKIVSGGIPADVISRTETGLAFRDLNPQADLHVLVVPLSHHTNVGELAAAEPAVLADLIALAQKVASEESGGSFRLVFNTGAPAGQSVFHAHGHVLGGRFWGWAGGTTTH